MRRLAAAAGLAGVVLTMTATNPAKLKSVIEQSQIIMDSVQNPSLDVNRRYLIGTRTAVNSEYTVWELSNHNELAAELIRLLNGKVRDQVLESGCLVYVPHPDPDGYTLRHYLIKFKHSKNKPPICNEEEK